MLVFFIYLCREVNGCCIYNVGYIKIGVLLSSNNHYNFSKIAKIDSWLKAESTKVEFKKCIHNLNLIDRIDVEWKNLRWKHQMKN